MTSLKNHIVKWIALGSFVVLATTLYIPNLRDLYRLSNLHMNDIAICLVAGVLSVIWLQLLPTKWTDPGNGKPPLLR